MDRLDELLNAHPALFKGRTPVVYSSLPPGWFSLVDKLCYDIELTLSLDELKDFECLQIKEKIGRLRFYFRSRHREKVESLVDCAMDASEGICPDCGGIKDARPGPAAAPTPHACEHQ